MLLYEKKLNSKERFIMLNFVMLVAAFVTGSLISMVIAYAVSMKLMTSKWFVQKLYKASEGMTKMMFEIDDESEEEA